MNLRKLRVELDTFDIQQVLSIALDEAATRHLNISKAVSSNRSRNLCSRIEYQFSRSVTAPDILIDLYETQKIMKHPCLQLSDFLVDFISERGGVMSVFKSATVIG